MSDDPYDERANERTKLLAGHQTLADGSRRIENSTRLALETEDLGADILRSLRVQREQIENTSHTVCHYYVVFVILFLNIAFS